VASEANVAAPFARNSGAFLCHPSVHRSLLRGKTRLKEISHHSGESIAHRQSLGAREEEEEEEEERLYLQLETRERVQTDEAKSKR